MYPEGKVEMEMGEEERELTPLVCVAVVSRTRSFSYWLLTGEAVGELG